MKSKLIALLSALALFPAVAAAAQYTVDISWLSAADGSTVNAWCALNAAPDPSQAVTATAPDSAGTVGTALTGNGGETLRCVARRANSAGNGPVSAEATAVLPVPLPGQIQIFLQIRVGP